MLSAQKRDTMPPYLVVHHCCHLAEPLRPVLRKLSGSRRLRSCRSFRSRSHSVQPVQTAAQVRQLSRPPAAATDTRGYLRSRAARSTRHSSRDPKLVLAALPRLLAAIADIEIFTHIDIFSPPWCSFSTERTWQRQAGSVLLRQVAALCPHPTPACHFEEALEGSPVARSVPGCVW